MSERYKWDNAGGVLPSECGEYVSFDAYQKLRDGLERIYRYDKTEATKDIITIAGVTLGIEKEEL